MVEQIDTSLSSTAVDEIGTYCEVCGEWVSYNQSHQCKGSWGGWYPPIKTVETCTHCGKVIEKWIDLNQWDR